MIRLWCISDIHGFHDQLIIPDNIDGIIVAGDISNSRNRQQNHGQVIEFLDWFKHINLPIKYLVAGNHDTSIEAKFIIPNEYDKSISYLEHKSDVISYDGKVLNIFGSPYTPSFGIGWAFNIARSVSHEYWKDIPYGTDIVVTHGPPKGVLDLSYSIEDKLEFCGDKPLLNRIMEIKPKYHIFGHIHNMKGKGNLVLNQGTRTINGVTYVNASCVTDGNSQGPTSNGVIIEI